MVIVPPEFSVTLSKREVAKRQLDSALRCFLDHGDIISAITLAGASEEILGKLLEKEGRKHSLEEFVEACVGTGRAYYGEEWAKKDFVEMLTYFKNSLKHIGDGKDITVTRDAAVEILDRAIDNHWALEGEQSELMRRYMDEVHGL
jgi:hypothetical protein